MGIAALFRRRELPGDVLGVLFQGLAVDVVEVHTVGGHLQQVAVVEVNHVPGVLENGGDVRGDVVAALAVAEDQGTVLFDADDGVGAVAAEDAQGVAALHPGHGPLDRLTEGAAAVIEVLDQVGHDLRVGLGVKFLPLLLQVLL